MIPNVEKKCQDPKTWFRNKKLYFTKIKILARFLPFNR